MKTKKQRLDGDKYYTPKQYVGGALQILKRCLEKCDQPMTYLDPCCGDGGLLSAITEYVDPLDKTFGTDIETGLDATKIESFGYTQRFDIIVTNPPYKQPDCQQIIENSYEAAKIGVLVFLRLSYLEPCQKGTGSRAKWLQLHNDNLRFIMPVNPRPRFRQDTHSTDSVTCAWFCWLKDFSWQRDFGIESPFQFLTK